MLACLVLLDHVLILGWRSYAIDPAGYASVLVFFWMSGLVLARAWDGDFVPFLTRRAVRLAPVYLLSWAAGCAVLAALMRPIDADPPTWSLSVEAMACGVFPAIVWAGRTWQRVAVAAVVLALLSLVAPHVGYFLPFILGARMASWQPRSEMLEMRPAQWLGEISYSLYLTHWIVLEIGLIWFGRTGLLLAVPAALAVGWLVWGLVERPSIEASRDAARAVRRAR